MFNNCDNNVPDSAEMNNTSSKKYENSSVISNDSIITTQQGLDIPSTSGISHSKFKLKRSKFKRGRVQKQNENLLSLKLHAYNSLPYLLKFFLFRKVNYFKRKPRKIYHCTSKEITLYNAIFHHNPKYYGYLSCTFPFIPLIKNLPQIQCHIIPGINSALFSNLNVISKIKKPLDRFCILQWDSMKLRQRLQLSDTKTAVDGLSDFGVGNRLEIADHVLILMIRGIRGKWKQPIAFYFVQRAMRKESLQSCIRQVIRAVHRQTEFRILASISDMGPSNYSTIASFSTDTEVKSSEFIYQIDGHEIVHFFDVTHLLKNLRNNFVTKDIIFNGKTAKWSDIKYAQKLESMAMDSSEKLSKLNIDNLTPKRKKQTLAAQVFSLSTAALLRILDNYESIVRHKSKLFQGTDEFLRFINNLFDSLNSNSKSGKTLRASVRPKSQHQTFWREALQSLEHLYFTHKGKRQPSPPCVAGFVITTRNILTFWKRLESLGFKNLSTKRCLNLDPLENLFNTIRNLSGPNRIPTCSQFVSAYKIAAFNDSIKSRHGANCDDDGDQLLLKQNALLSFPITVSNVQFQPATPFSFLSKQIPKKAWNELLKSSSSFNIARFVLKQILNDGCELCCQHLLTTKCTNSHSLIRLKNCNGKYYPQQHFVNKIQQLRRKVFYYVSQNITSSCILQRILHNYPISIYISCPIHSEMINILILYSTSRVMLNLFIESVNNKISLRNVKQNSSVDFFLKHAASSNLWCKISKRQSRLKNIKNA